MKIICIDVYTLLHKFHLVDTRQYDRIAFSSYLDHGVQNPGIDQTIIYNKIVLNEGSAYNENSGMLKAQ
jgi:hypothetical protein